MIESIVCRNNLKPVTRQSNLSRLHLTQRGCQPEKKATIQVAKQHQSEQKMTSQQQESKRRKVLGSRQPEKQFLQQRQEEGCKSRNTEGFSGTITQAAKDETKSQSECLQSKKVRKKRMQCWVQM